MYEGGEEKMSLIAVFCRLACSRGLKSGAPQEVRGEVLWTDGELQAPKMVTGKLQAPQTEPVYKFSVFLELRQSY